MRRTKILFFPLLLNVSVAFAVDQVAIEDKPVADQQVTESTVVSSDEEQPAALAPLELVRKLVASDGPDRFAMLPQVSPRGVDSEAKTEIVRLLIPLLESDHPDIRARTAAAIGLFGKEAEIAIPKLLNLIGDNEQTMHLASVWSVASKSLAKIGTASIEPCMEKMASAEGMEFYGISAVIADLGDHDEARATAPYFIEQLKNGNDGYKWAAVFCLSKLGGVAKPAIPEYIKLLDHPKFNMQVIACRALAALGPESNAAIPKLVRLTEKDGNLLSTRTHAAMCLGAIGPVDESIDLVSILTSMISEPNAFSQERGLIALGRLGAHAKEAAPFVAGLLDNEEFSQRPEAALALWKISGDAERSVELLRPMMTDLTYDSRALEAIREMGPAAASLAEPLVELLNTDDASLQLTIAEILEAMGPMAKQYLDKLHPLPDTAPPDIAVQLDEIIARIELAVDDQPAD